MRLPTSTKESRSKGFPKLRASIRAPYTYLPLQRIKPIFDKDPPKFVPQYGGFCAYGISLGVMADIEDSPKAFVVYNGKLYICGNEAALKKFMAGIDGNIEKADRQWQRISKL